MTLLDNLFSKKKPAKAASGQATGNGPPDSLPSIPSLGGHAADRKNLRLERRELLYAVVRESMARVGMLSSSYQYKVLSLDPRGRQYLIMMDLPQELAAETRRLAEIESVVTQNAKARHDIVVKAVYWRINVPASGGQLHQPRHTAERDASQLAPAAQVPLRPAGRFEPIQEDEVAAFKQALATRVHTEVPAPAEKPIKAWRRNPALHADFADTQLQEQAGKNSKTAARGRDFQDTGTVDSVEKSSPLSNTQYGDLN
jgi:hypothetical protein